MVVGPRETEQARWQEEAGGVLWCTRSVVPVKMGPKPVKWAVLPAQKCSGDALRAYLSGRGGCARQSAAARVPVRPRVR